MATVISLLRVFSKSKYSKPSFNLAFWTFENAPCPKFSTNSVLIGEISQWSNTWISLAVLKKVVNKINYYKWIKKFNPHIPALKMNYYADRGLQYVENLQKPSWNWSLQYNN